MAVFMINICKFNDCGIIFPRLTQLIEHIEDIHIDYDPEVVEQKEASQPSCIPLSYILKYISEASRRENHNAPPVPEVRRRLLSAPKTPSVRSSTPTGSEMDEDEAGTHSEDSNDSWTTVEEYSSEFILRYGMRMNPNALSGALGPVAQEKPFACPVPGCKKRYKNVNGIKYHSKNGHKKDGKVRKAYKCQCGKSYKTAQGFKSHSISQHIANSTVLAVPSELVRPAQRMPAVVVTASGSRPHHGPDGADSNKLVRIYDTLKNKDLSSFTITKSNLGINVLSKQSHLRHGLPSSHSPPVTSLVEKNVDAYTKVTVQSAQQVYAQSFTNETAN
ncbi:juxtaposed with another zinc finger protein 1 isoform X1 [Bombyx mori]|uniref:C2H2-type domain-containing protein n=1 Tax=Bombyx mori TaxID=7091 RepID=A0A8R1WK52_BOMMO|nr:juxtaposed with another zinc finger protein 1 isoform X1 [Bombyx mori]